MALEDKLVSHGAENQPITAVYNVPPAPEEGDAANPFWTATILSQGNPFSGDGTSVAAAIDAALTVCEKRGITEPDREPPVKKKTESSSSS